MKKYLLVASLLFLFGLQAESYFPEEPGKSYCDECSYLAPNRHCLRIAEDLQGLFVEADVLLWQARQRGLEFAVVNDANSLTNVQGRIVNPHFNWEAGYRIGLGYTLPYDGWRVGAYLTHFHTTSHTFVGHDLNDTFNGGGPGIISVWTHPQAFQDQAEFARWGTAEADWKLCFNIMTLEMDRAFCVGRYLTVKPHFGVKGGTIHQHFHIDYRPGGQLFPNQFANFSQVWLRNRTFCVGPFYGFASYWKVGDHWNFFGNIAGALLSTNFQLFHNQNDQCSFTNDNVKLKNQFWTFRPQAEISLGITWSACLGNPCKRSQYVGISFSYEAQYWWKENELPRFYNLKNMGTYLPSQGALMLQGLTVAAYFDF